MEQVEGLLHCRMVVDARDESGLDLSEDRCHFLKIRELQVVIIPGRFVVGRPGKRACGGGRSVG